MERFKLAMVGLLILAATGCTPPKSTTPKPGGPAPKVMGLLKITIEGVGGQTAPTAKTQWMAMGPGGIAPQAISLVNNYPSFRSRVVQFFDYDTNTTGGASNERYVSATFDISNNTSNSFSNMVLYAVNVPGNLGGTGILEMSSAAGTPITDIAIARSFKPTHGMFTAPLVPTVKAEGADLHLIRLAEVDTVKGQFNPTTNGIPTDAQPLQYGFLARNLLGGRAIGATGCTGANCNKALVTLGYKFPRPSTRSASPFSFSVYFAVGDNTTASYSQSQEEQGQSTVGGLGTSSIPGTVQTRVLSGSTLQGTNVLQLCRVFTAGSKAAPLAWMGPDPLPAAPDICAGGGPDSNPTPPKLEVRLYNADDEINALVNLTPRIQALYQQDSGRVNLSQYLTQDVNTLHFDARNIGGSGFTYGFQVWLNDALIYDEKCGVSGSASCIGEDTAAGQKFASALLINKDGSYRSLKLNTNNAVVQVNESIVFTASVAGTPVPSIRWDGFDGTSWKFLGNGSSMAYIPTVPGTHIVCANEGASACATLWVKPNVTVTIQQFSVQTFTGENRVKIYLKVKDSLGNNGNCQLRNNADDVTFWGQSPCGDVVVERTGMEGLTFQMGQSYTIRLVASSPLGPGTSQTCTFTIGSGQTYCPSGTGVVTVSNFSIQTYSGENRVRIYVEARDQYGNAANCQLRNNADDVTFWGQAPCGNLVLDRTGMEGLTFNAGQTYTMKLVASSPLGGAVSPTCTFTVGSGQVYCGRGDPVNVKNFGIQTFSGQNRVVFHLQAVDRNNNPANCQLRNNADDVTFWGQSPCGMVSIERTGMEGVSFVVGNTYTARLIASSPIDPAVAKTCTFTVGSGQIFCGTTNGSVTTNRDPIISSFTVTPTSGNVPLIAIFSWNANDADGDPLICKLDIDTDGTVDYAFACSGSSGKSHPYSSANAYTATLTVEDNKGGRTSRSTTALYIADQPAECFVYVFSAPGAARVPLLGSFGHAAFGITDGRTFLFASLDGYAIGTPLGFIPGLPDTSLFDLYLNLGGEAQLLEYVRYARSGVDRYTVAAKKAMGQCSMRDANRIVTQISMETFQNYRFIGSNCADFTAQSMDTITAGRIAPIKPSLGKVLAPKHWVEYLLGTEVNAIDPSASTQEMDSLRDAIIYQQTWPYLSIRIPSSDEWQRVVIQN